MSRVIIASNACDLRLADGFNPLDPVSSEGVVEFDRGTVSLTGAGRTLAAS